MKQDKNTIVFYADAQKFTRLRRLSLFITPLYALPIVFALLGSSWWILPLLFAIFMGGQSPIYFWQRSHKPLLTITNSRLSGHLVSASCHTAINISDLPSCPELIIKPSRGWKRWLGVDFPNAYIAAFTTNRNYRIGFDVSPLSAKDQQTVLAILQQRFQAEMSPEQ